MPYMIICVRRAAERAGRQEAASNPSAGSHLLSPGPWDLPWLLQEQETQSAAVRSPCPSQVLGDGEDGAGIWLWLPCAAEKQRPGQREAQALFGLNGERVQAKVVQAPGHPPPCQPFPGQENILRAPGSQNLKRFASFLPRSLCGRHLFPISISIPLSLFCVIVLCLSLSLCLWVSFISLCLIIQASPSLCLSCTLQAPGSALTSRLPPADPCHLWPCL